jgi:hypothetical protein
MNPVSSLGGGCSPSTVNRQRVSAQTQTGLDAEYWGMNATAVNGETWTSRVLEYMDHDHDHDARVCGVVWRTSYHIVQDSTGSRNSLIFIVLQQQASMN